jgi:hypothetical protein
MRTHAGAVRSFDLGGPGAAGRRWAARCSCGALATTGAWPEAITFLTKHVQRTARPRLLWTVAHPTPDLRGVEYGRPVVINHHSNGHNPRVSLVGQRAVRLLRSAVAVVLSLSIFRTG